jgi:hypothetical protein
MPTSLFAANNAVALTAKDDKARGEAAKDKKKKGCKC